MNARTHVQFLYLVFNFVRASNFDSKQWLACSWRNTWIMWIFGIIHFILLAYNQYITHRSIHSSSLLARYTSRSLKQHVSHRSRRTMHVQTIFSFIDLCGIFTFDVSDNCVYRVRCYVKPSIAAICFHMIYTYNKYLQMMVYNISHNLITATQIKSTYIEICERKNGRERKLIATISHRCL